MKKEEALSVVFICAQQYMENLANRKLLFICSDKHKNLYSFEVTFDISNFLHLTGLKANHMSAKDFFNRCLDRRLTVNDFEFADNGTTPMKLQILPVLVSKNLKANMVGNINVQKPKLYTEKLAGNIQGCIGFVKDSKSGRYVPNTVLREDIRNNVSHADRIILTYRKSATEDTYSEIVYSAKKVDWDTFILPEKYSNLPLPNTNNS